MININLSNMIGASSSVQSEPISTDASSTCLDFMSELKLELENNGDISNKTDDVDEGMMLYNYIYELYQKFNIQEDIVDSEKLELDNTLLDSNDIKEVIDYINNYIDEYKNISDKEELNKQFDLLVDKIKERLEAYEKSNNDIAIYEKLDSIGALNMLKIDDFNNSKNEDMDCLENILASDNNYTNSIVGFNKFSTVYNTNVNVEIEQPVSEIRQEFISDDIVKAVKYIKSNDMESLNVKFNPKDLGEISINISKNNEESNLLITVDDNNVFDFVNKNIEDIKNHLKDTNIDIKDVFITVKSDNENLFSDNLNRGFNQESNFKQNKNNKSKKDNQEIIDDLTINDYNNDDENLKYINLMKVMANKMTNINTSTSIQDTSSLKSRSVSKTENGTTIVTGSQQSDKDLFLKLLVAQMKNQDPFNSQDPTQYITQLAQFNMLEQTMTLNENIEYMIGLTNGVLANSAVGTASNLIGKDIEAYAPIDGSQSSDDTKTISGKVESVHIKDGVVYMNVKDSQSENIIEVEYGALIKVNG